MALYLLAAHLPEASVEPMSTLALDFLTSSSLPLISKTCDYTPYLVALVSWQRTHNLVQFIKQSITTCLDHGGQADNVSVEMNSAPMRRKRKVREAVVFVHACVCVLLAIKF